MARKVSVSAQDVKDSKGKAFGPLPAGKYLMNIYAVTDDEFKNGPNKGREKISVQFQVAEGQKKANARIFQDVGLFPRWAPKNGASEGANNFLFYQFFKAVGVTIPEDGGEIEIPDNDELTGEQVVIDLKVEQDDYKYRQAFQAWEREGSKGAEPDPNDFKRNAVKAILSADGFEAADESEAEADDDQFAL